MTLVNLPKGVKVYVGGVCWKGQIPEGICPEKFLPGKAKPAASSSRANK